MKTGSYYRLEFRIDEAKTRRIWAMLSRMPTNGHYIFRVLNRHGIYVGEFVICDNEDIVDLKEAQMNNKYAELELIDAKEGK